MLLKMFTVYDSKAEAYLPPFYLAASGQAVRTFADTANDPNHAFGKHPSDYTLFEIGVFDDQHASFNILDAKISLGTAQENIPPHLSPITEKSPSLKEVPLPLDMKEM